MVMVKSVKKRKPLSISKLFIHLVLGVFCLFIVLPMLLVISISLTAESALRVGGYALIPPEFSIEAYTYLFTDYMRIFRAYGITIFVTITGTTIGLMVTTAFAYTLSRKDFAYRGILSIFIFITMIFSGGLAPTYIMMTRWLGLTDSLLALILPGVIGAWNVFLMKGFLSNLPSSVIESATIDGASELKIFVRIVMPMSKAALATVGLFIALNYWNDWFSSLLYIRSPNLYSLQFLLYRIMANAQVLRQIALTRPGMMDLVDVPTLSSRMAMAVIASGPMLVAFAFLQKYFAKGIHLGSVKG
jgi:putative aldouronate transport system permease protein